MKRVFVITDNKFMFNKFSEVFEDKDVLVDYFCSDKSKNIFKDELLSKNIKPISLRNNYRELIKNDYFLGFSCHSKQIFPAELVRGILCINIHPGLNPYNRGWFPQVFSILNKYPVGATIHIMDEEIDHGEIIAQEEVLINSYDTSLDVYNRVILKEIDLFKSHIDMILDKNIKSTKMISDGNYNSIKDYKNICEIDLNKKVTMKESIDYLRAMTHPPYKNSYFIDECGNKVLVSINLEKVEK